MKRVAVFVAASVVLAAQAFAQIQPVITTDDKGSGGVDWESRFVVATGIGAPNPDLPEAAQRPGAMRAAQMIAIRNALETVKGIYLTSSTTVKNFMTENDQISTSVSGYVKGFEQQGRERYMSDGSVEITVKIPIDGIGGLGDKLLGSSVGSSPSVTAFDGNKAARVIIFTGLIIDCKGLKIKPALSPRVVDETGKEIYGSAYVTRDWAIKYGMVGYAKEVPAAARLDRVGKTPGRIKGMKSFGDNSTDVMIANKDAADVRSAADNLKFLSECRVVFVID